MMLRTYGSDTLNGNWAEERSKALRGVLSDFGHADPTAKSGALNMTQACMWQEPMRDRPVEGGAFNSLVNQTHPTGSSVARSKEAETTSRAAFGIPKRTCRTGHRMLHVPEATPSGWVEQRKKAYESSSPGGQDETQRTIRPRSIGERFMEGTEPAHSTDAQRSWVYVHDPVIKYHHEGAPVARSPRGLSLAVGEGRRALTASNQRSRNITLEREPNIQKGTSIWIDWHMGPGEA